MYGGDIGKFVTAGGRRRGARSGWTQIGRKGS